MNGYEPPFDVASTAQRILDSVPRKYLTGSGAIVLTNSGALSTKRRNHTIKTRQGGLGEGGRSVSPSCEWQFVRGSRYLLTTPCADGRPGGGSEFPLFVKASYPMCCSMKSAIIYPAPFAPSTAKGRVSADVWKVRLQRNYHPATLCVDKNRLSICSTLIGHIFASSKRKLELEMPKRCQISRAEYRESVAKKRSGDTAASR